MDNKWARLLAYVTGLVNQELLLQNEYLAAENRILKAHLQPGFRLTDGERTTLAEIGKRLGRKALQKVAGIAKPDTLLTWYHRLIAHKFDGSKQRRSVGRPRILGDRESGGSVGTREFRLGIRPDCGSVSQPGASAVRPDRRQHPAPAWNSTCPQAEPDDHLEGVHPPAHGRSVRSGLLHGRSTHLEGSGDVLRAVFHSPGQPASHHRRDHRASRPELDATDSPKRDI